MRLFDDDAPNYASASFPIPRPFQSDAHERLRQGVRDGHRCQMLMSSTGSGKCLGRDTPVLMADGSIKPVQYVVAGDRLCGPDGRVRNVLSIATGREQMYRICPKKGASYTVNASHILSLRTTRMSHGIRLSDGSQVTNDDDIVNINVETFAASNKTARHCLKGWRSDTIERFERNELEDDEERLIPPYILGAWLGDGTMGRAAISKPECRMVDEWIAYGKSIGYSCRRIAQDESDCPTWLLSNGQDGMSFNLVQAGLEAIGVADRKHIPSAYKFGPAAIRREVIAGLIDSDGHVTHGGCDWISCFEDLANDFAFVCRSLGLAAYVSPCRKGIASSGFMGDYWRVSVSGDLSTLPMRDKIAAKRVQKKRHLVHGITIEPIGIDDYFGFEIDGDGLFLLGDFTVTHNTYLGLRVIHEALKKGKRAIFVCDRRSLIEQTSAVADSYGLSAHGVLMANHNRYDLRMPFQIASAQTLARRQWPDADVIVIDEAHTQLKVWTDHIQETRAAVIGLSATPFSAGLGKLFSNLVNATSMHHLTESGVLVPMRVFSCAKVDMRGAETSGGEWTDRAAQERGMAIVGDVVTEWSKFASDRKTIVFGATIAHCEEMARQFNDAGVMAACFTSDTDQAERDMLLTEFRKPDSALRVLISVEALAKGFDCIAEGSMVLTDSGHKAIEKLSIDDRIWDGHEFVSHDGPIFKGERDVITYAGLTATPSHLVKTAAGWKTFMDCAQGGIPIVETAEGGRPVQEHDRRFRGGSSGSKNKQHHVHVPLREMWGRVLSRTFDIANSSVARVREVLRSRLASSQDERRESKVRQSKPQGICRLWWAGSRIQVSIREGWGAMGMGPSWAYSSGSACATGPDRQQRPLRAGKFAVDVKARECMQHQAWRMDGDGSQVSYGSPRNSIRGQDAAQSDKHGLRFESNHRQVLPEVGQTKRRVWDVLNAGPRNSFTCEGLLVHNCADVSCVCDVRPLRKSLSTAIQMWGRGLRCSPGTGKEDCVLRDTLILTDKGDVKIQYITLDHKVWDGLNFVDHCGAVCRGVRPVIHYDGLTATPDHEVMTNDGWKRFEDAARRKQRIIVTGIGGTPIRFCADSLSKDRGQRRESKGRSEVPSLFALLDDFCKQYMEPSADSGLPKLQWAQAGNSPKMALRALSGLASALHKSAFTMFRSLRIARDSISIFWSQRSGALGGEYAWCSGSESGTRPDRQQRPLRAGKFAVGFSSCEHEQHQSIWRKGCLHCFQKKTSRGEICRQNPSPSNFEIDRERNSRKVEYAIEQTEGEVWDILNAGPLQRFTANGRLVHNCLLLDFSGNIIRFADDFSDIFYNGLDELDCGEKLDKAIRREDEEKPEGKACPQCGYKPCGKRCVACGFEHQKRAEIEHEAGEMREVRIGKTKYADDKRHLWEQCCTYARGRSAPEKQRGRASNIYRDIAGEWPSHEWDFERTPNVAITRAVLNKIRQKNIAFAAMQQKAAA